MPEVTLPDGRVVTVNDGLSQEQLSAAVSAAMQAPPAGPEQGADEGGVVGFLRSAQQAVEPPAALQNAATLFLSDEIAGLVQGVGSVAQGGTFREGYKTGREGVLADIKQEEEDHPIRSAALQVLGGFGSVAGAPAAAASATRAVATAVGQGAGLGAVAGAAAADEGERVAGGIVGGVVGGGVAGVVSAVPPLVKAAGNIVSSMRGVKKPENVARRLVLRAFERDGISLDDANRMIRQWEAQGAKPETLADLGGKNIKGLLRAAQATPSSAKARAFRLLAERQETQGLRLEDDLASTLRLEQRGFYEATDELMTLRAEQAAPLYREAHAAGPLWSDALKKLAKRPSVSRALKQAKQIAAEEGVDLPSPFKVNGDGDIVGVLENPDARTWDYVKRGLDDVLETYRDKTTGRLVLDTLGKNVNDTRTALIAELDRLNPPYAAARAVWADKTTALESMERGRQFVLRDVELTAKDIADLPESAKSFFKLGAYRQLVDTIRRTPDGSNAARVIFGNPKKRGAIEALFEGDKDGFQMLSRLIEREQTMAGTRQEVLGNSVTARVGRELEDMADDSGFLAAWIGSGSLKEAAVQSAATKVRQGSAAARGIDDRVAGQVGDVLLRQGPTGMRGALEDLAAVPSRPAPGGRPLSARGGAAVAGAGAAGTVSGDAGQ